MAPRRADPPLGNLGRFGEPSLAILLALAEGPKHGYAIATDAEQTMGERLGPGTLYGALDRLERRGLIEALEPIDRRRPYRLTDSGLLALRTQLEGLAGVVEAGLARLDRRTP